MSLSVREVCVDIDGHSILDRVDLDVPRGSVVAVVGPSGIGKSTLLRVIAGIIRPASGSITIDGVDVIGTPTHKRRVGMVFQNDQLFPHLTVAENIAFGLEIGRTLRSRIQFASRAERRRRQERSRRVSDMLDLVGLEGFDDRLPANLSGGESKRVALARALANSPSVLLLDEPLTGLDRELHDRLMHDLHHILQASRTTAVLVTHDPAEAEFLASRIVTLGAPST